MKSNYIVWGAGASGVKSIKKAESDQSLIDHVPVNEKESVENLFKRNSEAWIVGVSADSCDLNADSAVLGYVAF